MAEKLLLSISDLAKLASIKENTVRVWLSKGTVIPKELIIRLGRRVLFNRNTILDWFAQGCPSELKKKDVDVENSFYR